MESRINEAARHCHRHILAALLILLGVRAPGFFEIGNIRDMAVTNAPRSSLPSA